MATKKSPQVCIMTVTGADRVGIIAKLASAMARANINILDVNQKIMEDVELLMRARKITSIYKLPVSVITSSRRFLRKGIIKTQLQNAWLLTQYLLGKNPNKIYIKYYAENL